MNSSKILLILVVLVCVNMGEGGRHFSSSGEPIFAPLEEKQGSYLAIVHDERSQTVVRDISFFGQTVVGGIRRESDDSFNRLDLAKIKEIEVVQAAYDSKRYSDRELALVKVIMANGKAINDLLAPKNVVVCGIERDTGAEKTWWLRKVNKIIIKGRLTFNRKALSADKKKRQADELKKFLAQEKEYKKNTYSIFSSFVRIIDSLIDFVKTLFKSILSLVGF